MPPRTAPVETASPAPPGEPTQRAAPVEGPVTRWSRPWLVVWALVGAIPLVALALRLLDESGHHALVAPVGWAFAALLVGALAVTAMLRARRSPARFVLGVIGALAVAVALVWPVTSVTLGRTPCPSRAGRDLGAPVAAAALEAWRNGTPDDAGWREGRVDRAWIERARNVAVLDYVPLDSGCWERMAPVDGSRTWHEFRATVVAGERNHLSKLVVVHTARGPAGWKITAIEGPLP